MTSKTNLLVIAKANSKDDTGFYELLLKDGLHVRDKAHVYFFSSVDDFHHFISSVHKAFSFTLLIHPGGVGANPSYDGIEFTKKIQKLEYHSKLNFYFATRGTPAAIQENDTIYALHLLDEEYDFTKLKTNLVGDLLPKDSNGLSDGNKIEIAVITALFEDEFKAFSSHMIGRDNREEKNQKIGKFREVGDFKEDYKGEIRVTWQQDMGSIDAAAFSSRIIAKHKPKYLILAGVCGGLKESVKLYDLIIPKNIHDYMSGKFVKGKFSPRPLTAEPNSQLIGFIQSNKEKIIEIMRKIASEHLKPILNDGFQIHIKNYACGPWMVKTTGKLLEIAESVNADIIGLEMESLGVIRASNLFAKYNEYGLVVKSVMDFTDENKTDGIHGDVKKNAAEMSYLGTRAIISILHEFSDTRM